MIKIKFFMVLSSIGLIYDVKVQPATTLKQKKSTTYENKTVKPVTGRFSHFTV
ncbi:MAG TPA: hypothetical protein VHO72_11450 [Bacteroidales bacterium]|nr:hypothetical protein [Bacteroidales bacterium]